MDYRWSVQLGSVGFRIDRACGDGECRAQLSLRRSTKATVCEMFREPLPRLGMEMNLA